MEGFGNVNMMAIEQYDECQARLDLMKDEFATLQARRKHLIEVLNSWKPSERSDW